MYLRINITGLSNELDLCASQRPNSTKMPINSMCEQIKTYVGNVLSEQSDGNIMIEISDNGTIIDLGNDHEISADQLYYLDGDGSDHEAINRWLNQIAYCNKYDLIGNNNFVQLIETKAIDE